MSGRGKPDPKALLANVKNDAKVTLKPTTPNNTTSTTPTTNTQPARPALRPTPPTPTNRTTFTTTSTNNIETPKTNTESKCVRCENNPTSFKCTECAASYCTNCDKEAHIGPLSSHHRTSLTASTPPRPTPPAATNKPVNLTSTANGTSPVAKPPPRPVQAASPPARPAVAPPRTNPVTPPARPALPSMFKQVNTNTEIDWSDEQGQMETLKEQYLDEVIDMLMSVALGLLTNGVLLTEVDSGTSMYYKLSPEQTHIDCHQIQDPSLLAKRASIQPSNSEKIGISEINDIVVESHEGLTFKLILKGSERLLKAADKNEFVLFVDGLRCLAGMDMQTPEMQASLRSLLDAKASVKFFQKPAPPQRPTNFTFVSGLDH